MNVTKVTKATKVTKVTQQQDRLAAQLISVMHNRTLFSKCKTGLFNQNSICLFDAACWSNKYYKYPHEDFSTLGFLSHCCCLLAALPGSLNWFEAIGNIGRNWDLAKNIGSMKDKRTWQLMGCFQCYLTLYLWWELFLIEYDYKVLCLKCLWSKSRSCKNYRDLTWWRIIGSNCSFRRDRSCLLNLSKMT